MAKDSIILSALPKTWILDLDGTIVKHNGYLQEGMDTILSPSLDFIKSLPESDVIIILTSRSSEYSEITEKYLTEKCIRYD